MSENLALSELVESLKQSKEQEYQAIKQIESEKLSVLSRHLGEQLHKELNTIEEDMTTQLYSLHEKLSKARSTIIKQENDLLKEIQLQRKKIRAEIKEIGDTARSTAMKLRNSRLMNYGIFAMMSLWTLFVIWSTAYLMKHGTQDLFSKEQVTQEEVNEYLQTNYTIHKTADGWRLIEKKQEGE
jgi:hypothetical protein